MVRKIEKAARILERLEGRVKPGRRVLVWYERGSYYENKEGKRFKKGKLPGGENIINIIIETV